MHSDAVTTAIPNPSTHLQSRIPLPTGAAFPLGIGAYANLFVSR